jgi:hypothetical protein
MLRNLVARRFSTAAAAAAPTLRSKEEITKLMVEPHKRGLRDADRYGPSGRRSLRAILIYSSLFFVPFVCRLRIIVCTAFQNFHESLRSARSVVARCYETGNRESFVRFSRDTFTVVLILNIN